MSASDAATTAQKEVLRRLGAKQRACTGVRQPLQPDNRCFRLQSAGVARARVRSEELIGLEMSSMKPMRDIGQVALTVAL